MKAIIIFFAVMCFISAEVKSLMITPRRESPHFCKSAFPSPIGIGFVSASKINGYPFKNPRFSTNRFCPVWTSLTDSTKSIPTKEDSNSNNTSQVGSSDAAAVAVPTNAATATLRGDLSSSDSELEEPRISRLNFVATFLFKILSTFNRDLDLVATFSKAIAFAFWLFVGLSALGTLGVDTKPLLSFLGIGGITLGLSLKDILSDVYAGLFVLFTRPFARGAVISVAGTTGKVISMSARYVRLYNAADSTIVLLPMSAVYKNTIKIQRSGNKAMT